MGEKDGPQKEPSPEECNQELRRIYEMIPPCSKEIRLNPKILNTLIDLIERTQTGEAVPTRVVINNPFDPETVLEKQEEISRRRQSQIPEILSKKIEKLLSNQGRLPQAVIDVVLLQFADDYSNGRRPETPITEEGEVRFASSLLLGDFHSPMGVFDPNTEVVKEIERTMLGAYEDWIDTRAFCGDNQLDHEMDLDREWNQAFKKRYKELPFPNLGERFPDSSQN